MIRPPVPVVLASSSPQRHGLLRKMLERFDVVWPAVDETFDGAGGAEAAALALAQSKAEEVARRCPDSLVIAADTMVECRGEVIGKPSDRAHAVAILTKLTAHPHRIVTGLCVLAPDGRHRSAVSVSDMRLRRLSPAEIEAYVDSQEVLRRAGAYGLEELDPNVLSLRGSPSSVMGLPLEELRRALLSLYPECDASECASTDSAGS